MKIKQTHKCHGGDLQIWEHGSTALNCPMTFSIFLPEASKTENVPFITFLSGLTCTHDNFTTKAGAYKYASDLGIAIIAPDTSPRGDDVPDDEAFYFGKGAGFYINATQKPWSKHYRMESYIADELYHLLPKNFPLNKDNQSICGHSMGGHGALTLYFKYRGHYKSVSAFAPIVNPSDVPWGQKAFKGYLGNNINAWKQHDACELVHSAKSTNAEILIDQGLGDDFLGEQLRPEIFKRCCEAAGQKINLRVHEGYDHSYYFISTFIEDHLIHHANILSGNR